MSRLSYRAIAPGDVPPLDASKITTGQLTLARGGTDNDTSGALAGAVLIATGLGTFAANRLSAGTGITIGNSVGTVTITGTGGTVTQVGLAVPAEFNVSGSPVTSIGTITIGKAAQFANTVWAAPNGSTGGPTFRALVAADIPPLDASAITTGTLAVARGGTALGTVPSNGQVLIGNGTGYALSTLTAGTGISITNGAGSVTIANTGAGSGTVTSVGLSLPPIFSVSGSPVTSSGTLSASLATEAANLVFAGPTTGAAAAPTFRSMVAADVPSLPASQITSGQLAAARGGTGLDTSAVTDGQVLIGRSSDHSFGLATLTAGSGVTITNAGHAVTIAAAGGASLTGSTVKLAADVALTSANTYFDGPTTGTLAAGTYLITATVSVKLVANAWLTAKLWDGTTAIVSTETFAESLGLVESMSLSAVVSASGSQAFKVSLAANSASSATMAAATVHNNAGNNATSITYVKIA